VNTITRGNAAEAAVLKALIDAAIPVFLPFGEGSPFDLAAAMPGDGSVARIQVKSGRVRNGCVMFNTCSTDHGHGRRPYHGLADVFAVYVVELSQVFMVPVRDCPRYVGFLRLEPCRNNQRVGIRFAEEYKFDRWSERAWQSAMGGVNGRTPAPDDCGVLEGATDRPLRSSDCRSDLQRRP
jgi:hypothetical protein